MRRLALVLAAGSLVAVSGCCWGGAEPGACVVETVWGQSRCEPIVADEGDMVCLVDPVEPVQPVPSPGQCGGAFHGGRTCAEVGFTVACDGGYWVRPGNPC